MLQTVYNKKWLYGDKTRKKCYVFFFDHAEISLNDCFSSHTNFMLDIFFIWPLVVEIFAVKDTNLAFSRHMYAFTGLQGASRCMVHTYLALFSTIKSAQITLRNCGGWCIWPESACYAPRSLDSEFFDQRNYGQKLWRSVHIIDDCMVCASIARFWIIVS